MEWLIFCIIVGYIWNAVTGEKPNKVSNDAMDVLHGGE